MTMPVPKQVSVNLPVEGWPMAVTELSIPGSGLQERKSKMSCSLHRPRRFLLPSRGEAIGALLE